MYIRLIPQGLAVPVLTALVYANKVKKRENPEFPSAFSSSHLLKHIPLLPY